MFNVGDMAVYPAHGVGVIEAIETKTISGNEHVFYVMRLLENDMKIMIPRKNAAQVGLRSLISKEDIERVYAILNEKKTSNLPLKHGIAAIVNIWTRLKPVPYLNWQWF